MGTGTNRRSISSLELTYSCIYVYISVYFYLELMEGQRNRAARVLANPFRQRALGRVAELGDDLPGGHALREIQVNGPAPILHRKHADSNPDAQASNFPSASPISIFCVCLPDAGAVGGSLLD